MPNAIGTTVLDCTTGKVLWQDESVRIICGAEEIVLAQRGLSLDRPSLLLLDLRTGETLEEIGQALDRAGEFRAICENQPPVAGWINSSPLAEDSTRYRELSEIIEKNIPDRRGGVEIADYGTYSVLSLHERSRRSADAMLAGLVDNVLIVLEGDRVVHRETVTKDAPAVSDDLFFIWNGMLIFIREGRTLVGINLSKD
jgi:hypothetical protein